MSFVDKLKFWKKDNDPLNFDNAFGGQNDSFDSASGNEPLPPLDDPSQMGADPLASPDPLSAPDPLASPESLTPGAGVADKYAVPQDPLASNNFSAQESMAQSQNTSSLKFSSGHKSEKELTDSLARKYVAENEAREQQVLGQPQQQNQNGSSQSSSQNLVSSRDLEIINLKLDAVKSDVSSLGHQLEKIERMLKDKKSW